jgi:hypothetical protein
MGVVDYESMIAYPLTIITIVTGHGVFGHCLFSVGRPLCCVETTLHGAIWLYFPPLICYGICYLLYTGEGLAIFLLDFLLLILIPSLACLWFGSGNGTACCPSATRALRCLFLIDWVAGLMVSFLMTS